MSQVAEREVSRRINPDSLGTLWLALSFVIVLAVVSFMVSFAGLSEIARWVGLPPMLSWTVPTFIDTAIIAYGLAALIHRHRGEPSGWSMVSLLAFTMVSVIANGAHALSVAHDQTWQGWIGAGIAGLAPLAVFASTEELGRLVIEQPTRTIRHTIPSDSLAVAPAEDSETPDDDGPGSGSRPEPEATPVEIEEEPTVMDEPTLPATDLPEPTPQPAPEPDAPAEPAREPEPVAEAPEEMPGQVDVFDALADLDAASETPEQSAPAVAAAEAEEPQPVAAPVMPRWDLRPRITPVQRTVAEVRAEAEMPITSPADPVERTTPVMAARPTLAEPVAPSAPSPAAGGGQVTEMDQVARYVATQVNAGNTPRAAELAEILGCVERTARRKIAKLREDRPELFEGTKNDQIKEA